MSHSNITEHREALFRWLGSLLYERSAWLLIMLIYTLMLIRTGIWCMPNIYGIVMIASNPFTNPLNNVHSQYQYWNWLGPFLSWLIGAHSLFSVIVFHLCCSIAFVAFFTWHVFTRFQTKTARKSLILFSLIPVSATALFWVGMDSITLLLLLDALIIQRLALILGFALGLQHFEQGFFATAGLLVAVVIDTRTGRPPAISTRFCLVLLAGVVLGKLFLIGLFNYNHIDVNSGRVFMLHEFIYRYITEFIFHFPYILFSLLGLGWIVFLRYLSIGNSIGFIIVFFLLSCFSVITEDETRVVCIITFPLLATYWLFNEEFLERIGERELSILFLFWAITPWAWTWAGIPRWSVFPYDIVLIAHILFGVFVVPANITDWPFQNVINLPFPFK